jgi:hypothetical protein
MTFVQAACVAQAIALLFGGAIGGKDVSRASTQFAFMTLAFLACGVLQL